MRLWARLKARIVANPPTVIASIAVIAGVLFIPNNEYRWIGHGIIGLTAFSFAVVTTIYGVTLAGRIRRPPNRARFRSHRKLGITTGSLTITTLAYGLWMVFAREYPLLDSIHGKVGLIVLTLSLIQILTGLTFRRRKSTHLVHRWSGYFFAGLIGIQIILGVFLTPVFAGETPRYTVRLSTPPVEETWRPNGIIGSREYFFRRILDGGNYEISYRTDGEYIYVGLKVRTTGWVGLGISAGSGMQNADIVFARVTDTGQVIVEDQFGVSTSRHLPDIELGGTDDIIEFGGKEDNGYTIIEFKRRIAPKDRFDIPLVEGIQTLIWAYGSDDKPVMHVTQGYFEIRLR